MKPVLIAILAGWCCSARLAWAQMPDVPVHDDAQILTAITKAGEALHAQGQLSSVRKLAEGLSRSSCVLALPACRTRKRTAPEVWQLARQSSLVVGILFRCQTCAQWHLNAASGFAITSDGAVVTCHHLLAEDKATPESYLLAADLDGNVYPVREVLAANIHADTCVLRIAAPPLTPLPLNDQTRPGETVYCFSNPDDNFGYFSQGIIARFFWSRDAVLASDPRCEPDARAKPACFMAVTAEFAVGSSGAALLDECGNAVAHVQSTSTVFADAQARDPGGFQMTLRQATAAREVLALIKPQSK